MINLELIYKFLKFKYSKIITSCMTLLLAFFISNIGRHLYFHVLSIFYYCVINFPILIIIDLMFHIIFILHPINHEDIILKHSINNFIIKISFKSQIVLIILLSISLEWLLYNITNVSTYISLFHNIRDINYYTLKLNNLFSLYFISCLALGIIFLLIFSSSRPSNIHLKNLKIWFTPVLSWTAIIGVMITALSFLQKGANIQSISYNFYIAFIYIMTPICIFATTFIHIVKTIQNDELHSNIEHILDAQKHIYLLIRESPVVKNNEMYHSKYHYTD